PLIQSSRRRRRSASGASRRRSPSGWPTVSERGRLRTVRLHSSLPPRRIPTSRSALGLAAVALVVAGCGGHERRAEPHLLRSDARQLVALAQQVARDAPSDGCAAQREVAALSAQARSLVTA